MSKYVDHAGEWSNFFGTIFALAALAFWVLVITAVGIWAWHQVF